MWSRTLLAAYRRGRPISRRLVSTRRRNPDRLLWCPQQQQIHVNLRFFSSAAAAAPHPQALKPSEIKLAEHLFKTFAVTSEEGSALDAAALKRLCEALGGQVTVEQVQQTLQRCCQKDSGQIQLDHFIEHFHIIAEASATGNTGLEAFVKLFNMLDADKNGTIEKEELIGLITTTKKQLTEEEVALMFEAAHTEGDSMTLQQFVKFMQNNPLISLLLRSSFRVIYVCGGPGSGKGTVCEAIAAQTNSVHVSSGDLLRQEVEQKTSLGNECAELMQEGKLVDASIVLALLEKFLITHPGHYAMLDGFPRSLQNAEDFHDLFGPPACVLMFDCPDEVMVERIVERGRTSARADDNETTAHERVKVFHAQSQPSMQFLQEQHVPVYKLDATAPKETVINEAMQLPMFKKGMFDLG